ncbi:MAG: hypothetical protein ACON34_06625 [Flavobacteriales bacterium]
MPGLNLNPAHPDHFVMEKSVDGEYWTTLFAESALVDVEGTHSYQDWDPEPVPGLKTITVCAWWM